MKLMVSTEENYKSICKLDHWEYHISFGTYIDEAQAILYADINVVKAELKCSDHIAKLVRLISALHEEGHYLHRHTDEMISCPQDEYKMEAEAWIYVFKCIKTEYHLLVWTVFDYLYAVEATEFEQRRKEETRKIILSSSF